MPDRDDLVQKHYDAAADAYHAHYDRSAINDPGRPYPANSFRLNLLINAFAQHGVKSVLEVGSGEGTPLVTLARAGMDVRGFDLSPAMVERARANFRAHDLDEGRISWGDIQDPVTYSPLLAFGKFDALLAMGVMPHIANDRFVLQNMKTLVRPGGRVFIEFRNKLFSLFTFNRHTRDFILDDLLAGVSPALKDRVAQDLQGRLALNQPPVRDVPTDDGAPGYDAILSKFHNPFEVLDLFRDLGFSDAKLLWYHYHPAMPFLSDENRALYRTEAVKLENETSGWRGFFLCSAFVVEAHTAL